MQDKQIHPAASSWDFHIHRPIHANNELVKIGKEEMLSDEAEESFGDLQNSESYTGNKVTKIIQ